MTLRALYYLMLTATILLGCVVFFLTAVLVRSEPVEFEWATQQSGGDQRNPDGSLRPDAQITTACDPIYLTQPNISFQSVADFATEAVIAVNSYDYLSWRKALPDALNQYFTPRAGRLYLGQFENSNLLGIIERSFFTVSALNVKPAMVVAADTTIEGARSWTVQVPVILRYQTGASVEVDRATQRQQTEVFTVTLVDQRPTERNFRGLAVNDIRATGIRDYNDLERLPK